MKKSYFNLVICSLFFAFVCCFFPCCGVNDMKNSPKWAEKSVFYQVFVRSFYDSDGDGVGDFNGVAQKLDYIQDLGADAIWLMPINKCETYHGYDIVDYYDVNDEYGSMEDLENLINQCHQRGIHVIMDLVINHTSYHHPWFLGALNGDEDLHDRYIFVDDPSRQFNIREAEDGQRFYAVFSSHMPDLNYRNSDVRSEMLKVADFWLDKGFDGFRLDAAKFIDEDNDITHKWWKEFSSHVWKKKPDAFIVGENWVTKLNEISGFYGDMNSSFNFNLCETIGKMAQGQVVDIASRVNNMRQAYFDAAGEEGSVNRCAVDSTMIGNHDMDRVASLLKGNVARAKLAAVMLFTLPGTPFIYYGEELGMLGKSPDPNRREPMDWYASGTGEGMTCMERHDFNGAVYTVANDGISLEEEAGDDDSIYNFYKKLIKIRRDNDFVFTGKCESVPCKGFGLYRFKNVRGKGDDFIDTVLNVGKKDFEIKVDYDCVDLLSGREFEAGDVIKVEKERAMILKEL